MTEWTRKNLARNAIVVGLMMVAGMAPAEADPVITSPTEWTDDFTYDTSVYEYVAQHGGIWSCAPTIVARYDGVTHMELIPDTRPALVHSYRVARTTPTAQEFRRLSVTGMSGGTETGRFGLFDQDNQGHASIELVMSQGVWKLYVVQGNVGGIFNTQVDRAAVGDWTIDWHTDRVAAAYNGQTVVDTTTTPIETTYGGGMGIPTEALQPYFYKSSNGTMMRVDGASWGAMPVAALLPGDANGDGCVDDLDLTALAVNWQQATSDWDKGDFNGDGIVDDLDLTALAVNWQQGCGGGGSLAATNVPEPGSAGLMLLASLGLIRCRKAD